MMTLKHPDRDKWRAWLDRISDEMVGSAIDRHVFDRWWSIIQSNPKVDVNNRLMALIWASYYERQALAVRRQLDLDKSAISLRKLMEEVAAYAGQLGRADFISGYTGPEDADGCREAGALFDTFVDPATPDVVSTAVVQAHIEGLRNASSRLKKLADKWLAHSDSCRFKWCLADVDLPHPGH